KPPADLPPYLRALYTVPLLSHERERELFRRYNFLKYKADMLRREIDVNHIRTSQLKQIEALLLRANAVKNQIVRANLRLVVSIAKKHVGGAQTLFELISDGNVSLMRAVEKFDYMRGFRFSTYSSWAIMRNFARSVPRERYQLDRFSTGNDEILDIAAGLRTYDPNEVNLSELRESIEVVLAQLTPTERSIVIDHYGLTDDGTTKTLEQLAGSLGLSKERVRQIEIAAFKKLRVLMHPEESHV
ncbi:MAG: sigma-70 family RNA polymerase sigma factor, partial [Phycisphaerae bacterium]|nr:sigma-70 family RNA polymerase sigma factor [Phycisphaerae bacterium]